MAKLKKEDVFSCGMCGLIVAVDEAGIGVGELFCCKTPMAKGKTAAAKARGKALAAEVQKPAVTIPPDKKAAKKAPAAEVKTAASLPKRVAKNTVAAKGAQAGKKK